jgi:hypothetical protein
VDFTLIASLSAALLFLVMLAFSELGRRVGIARLARDADGLAKGAGAASLTVYVIVDLEFPRLGLIRVDAADQVLIDLRGSIH